MTLTFIENRFNRTERIASALILAASICFSMPIASNQWAVWQPQGSTSGNIYYNGGNVGIGTASPRASGNGLDIAGTVSISNSANVGYVDFTAAPRNAAGLLRIMKNGIVGIRTTSPDQTLTIGSRSVLNSSGTIGIDTCNSSCSGNREWSLGLATPISGMRMFTFGTLLWEQSPSLLQRTQATSASPPPAPHRNCPSPATFKPTESLSKPAGPTTFSPPPIISPRSLKLPPTSRKIITSFTSHPLQRSRRRG